MSCARWARATSSAPRVRSLTATGRILIRSRRLRWSMIRTARDRICSTERSGALGLGRLQLGGRRNADAVAAILLGFTQGRIGAVQHLQQGFARLPFGYAG